MPPGDPSDLDESLVGRLRETAKYQGLCDEVLHWAVEQARERTSTDKEALKLAKRKLHQVYGAFVDRSRRKQLLRQLRSLTPTTPPDERGKVLRRVADLHQSTAERQAHHGALWAFILGNVGTVASVADLGCGANPALLPFTGLGNGVRYVGWDLDGQLCSELERALEPLFPNAVVTTADACSATPPAADLTLCWKLLPTLERQRAGAAQDLVDRLGPTTIVATFPTRTLSGRDRGMESTYRAFAERLLGPGRSATIGDELVWIVSWGGRSGAPTD